MENEGLCRGEIQIRVAQRDVLLVHFEKVTSRKWLSSGGAGGCGVVGGLSNVQQV